MFVPLYSNNEPPTPSFTPIGDEPTNPVTLITPTTNSTGSSTSPSLFSKIGGAISSGIGAVGNAIGGAVQGAGNLLSNLYGSNIQRGLAETPNTSAETVLKPFASMVGGSSPTNLPFGVGNVVSASKEFLNNPQTPNVTFGDWLNGMKTAGQGFIGQVISGATELPNIATGGAFQPQIKFNLPGIGEISNSDYKIADQVMKGADPTTTVLQEKTQGFLNALFFVGLATQPFLARPTVIGETTSENVPTGKGVVTAKPMESFQRYTQPRYTTPLTDTIVQKLATEQGVTLPDNYNPDIPTYFKMVGTSGGKITSQVIQIKPSYFDTFLNTLNGDVGKVPTNETLPVIPETNVSIKSIEEAKPISVPVVPPAEVTPTTPTPSFTSISKPEAPVKAPQVPETAPQSTIILKERLGNIKTGTEIKPDYITSEGIHFEVNGKKMIFRPAIIETMNEASQRLFGVSEKQFDNLGKQKQITPETSKVSPDLQPLAANPSVIQDNQNQIQQTYKSVPSEKLNTATGELMQELDLSQAGYRIMTGYGDDAEVKGVSSSFPQWIPEELRSKALFDKVMPYLDPTSNKFGTFPDKNQTKTRALVQELYGALDQHLGTDTKLLRDNILNEYDKTTNKETANFVRGSIKGTERIEPSDEEIFAKWGENEPNQEIKPAEKPTTPPDLQSLAQKAQKYKSAEEFVKAKMPSEKSIEPSATEASNWNNVSKNIEKGKPGVTMKTENGDMHTFTYRDESGNPIGILKLNDSYYSKTLEHQYGKDVTISVKPENQSQGVARALIQEAQKKGFNTAEFFSSKDNSYTPQGYKLAKSQLTDFYNKVKGKVTVPEVNNPPPSRTELNAGINPHIDQFIENDLKPAFTTAKGGLVKSWDFIKKIFNPSARSPEALQTASILREALARMARRKEITYQALQKARKTFDTYTKEQSLAFIDKLETGQPTPEAENFVAIMREALDTRWKQIQDIKGTDAYIENYFPHIWKDPEKATQVLQGFGKRPFEGTKGYMKQRTIPTTKEGVALGLEPASYNPVELIMARISDMDRFIMANDVWTQFKEQGLNKFVRPGGDIPTNWIKVDDKIASKFYKPTVKEYFDEKVMTTLEQVAKDFGITHERVQGMRGNILGKSYTGQDLVKTKFATPEAVLLHELGHQLDPKFDIQTKFAFGKETGQTRVTKNYNVVETKESIAYRQKMKAQMRALVDTKWEDKQVSEYFKNYVRKSEEKVAALFEAYLQAPVKFKEVAPDIYKQFKDFLKSEPKLKPILNLKPSMVYGSREQSLGILAKAGDWYMPETAATVVNNYLSPGLTNNPIYNAFRMAGNTLNQVQLGFSGYHALFTSADAVISKAALEIQKGKLGFVKAVFSPITAPYYLWKNLTRGNALLKDYFSKNPQVPEIVDALERAGGRVKTDGFYLNNAVTNFMKAVRSENLVGAIIRAPGAIIEEIAKPIMQELVPRQKLGVFSDMAQTILQQAEKEEWTEYKTTLRLQEAWDSVDNRMGQLVYDNLFWNKVTKDLGMVATRSLGWNLGTFRELGGGVKDYAKTLGQSFTKSGRENIRMTPKMAYTLALPWVMAVWGAIIYYLYNHKAPESLLDYYYPKTGKTKTDGTPERISLPSYMKDVFAYWTQPSQTVFNKLHPEISTIIDMLQNKDYYGTEIRNPSDPLVKQLKDLAIYQAEQFVPFTITNLMQRQKLGGSFMEYLQSFAGITPAPGYITRSPLQTDIYNLYDLRFGGGVQSQQQKDIANQKAEVRTLYLTGQTDAANKALDTLVTLGIVKNKSSFMKEADIPSDVKLFTQLPADDQTNLVKKMNLYELERYAFYVKPAVKASFSTISNNTKDFMEMMKNGDVQKPVWEKGIDTNLSQ